MEASSPPATTTKPPESGPAAVQNNGGELRGCPNSGSSLCRSSVCSGASAAITASANENDPPPLLPPLAGSRGAADRSVWRAVVSLGPVGDDEYSIREIPGV